MATLPTTTWGDPGAERRALLLHGINGSAEAWWLLGDVLASEGWFVTAVDLRGHGRAASEDSYLISEYVDDLPGSGWDLLLGHSLGAAIAVVAAGRPGFAEAIALLDPVLEIPAEDVDAVRQDQLDELTTSYEELRAAKPLWDERDVAAKHEASQLARREMVEATFSQNSPWDLVDEAERLAIPTLVVAADPAVFTMFQSSVAERLAHNPLVNIRVIEGAGHAPHRDRPDETIAVLREWLSAP